MIYLLWKQNDKMIFFPIKCLRIFEVRNHHFVKINRKFKSSFRLPQWMISLRAAFELTVQIRICKFMQWQIKHLSAFLVFFVHHFSYFFSSMSITSSAMRQYKIFTTGFVCRDDKLNWIKDWVVNNFCSNYKKKRLHIEHKHCHFNFLFWAHV